MNVFSERFDFNVLLVVVVLYTYISQNLLQILIFFIIFSLNNLKVTKTM